MAKHVLYNGSVILNSIDLSDHVVDVDLKLTLNSVSAAAMGDVEDYDMASTRKVGDITITLFQDFAASKTWATLNGLWTNRSSFTALIKADAGANATTNPQASLSVIIKTMGMVTGKRGEAHMCQVVLTPTSAMTILTS